MRVIFNRYIPFGQYYAINLFGVVFVRKGRGLPSATDLNHEYIHTLQQREMLYLFFYLWYLIEWGIGVLRYRNMYRAYYAIRFEREAYAHQNDKEYSTKRRCFAWLRA